MRYRVAYDNDHRRDEMFSKNERALRLGTGAFLALWIVCFLTSLGLIGVVVWAIIRVVLKYT